MTAPRSANRDYRFTLAFHIKGDSDDHAAEIAEKLYQQLETLGVRSSRTYYSLRGWNFLPAFEEAAMNEEERYGTAST